MTSPGPTPFDGDALSESISRLNAEERRNRTSYYEYLLSRGPETDTLEEHIEKYGFLARLPGPVTPAHLEALGRHVGMPLPAQLRDFYLRFGGLIVGQMGFRAIELPAPDELLERLALAEGWRRVASLGLVDMVLASWGNEREEFLPGYDAFQPEELTRANADIRSVGWIDVDGGEGRSYVAFDRSGEVYLLRFHQDEVDTFRSLILSVLDGDGAPVSLSGELVRLIDRATEGIRELQED